MVKEQGHEVSFDANSGKLMFGDILYRKDLDNKTLESRNHSLWKSSFDTNLPMIHHSADASMLRNLFKNKSALAIAIGNGPSFHDNIDELEKLCERKKPFIIACDRVYNKLCEHGIRPDLTITIDGQQHVADFFQEDYICSNDYFLPLVTTHPDVIAKIKKGKIFWGGLTIKYDVIKGLHSDLWREIYRTIGVRFWNTAAAYLVGDMGVRIGAAMGFHIVASLGNDLSFRDNGHNVLYGCQGYPFPHSQIEPFDEDRYRNRYNFMRIDVQRHDGPKEYLMSEAFLLAARSMTGIPAMYKDFTEAFIDLSDAPIYNWQRMTMEELVDFVRWNPDAYNTYNYRWQLHKVHRAKLLKGAAGFKCPS